MNEQERTAVLHAIDLAMQTYATDLSTVTTVEHLRRARVQLGGEGDTPSSRWPSLREIPELSDEQLRDLAKVSETRLSHDLAVVAGVAYELHCGLAEVAARSAYVDERTLDFLTDQARAFRERYERLGKLLDEVDPAERGPAQRRQPERPSTRDTSRGPGRLRQTARRR